MTTTLGVPIAFTRCRWVRSILSTLLLYVCASATLGVVPSTAAPVDFNRDIRPILADACYKCHGPDEENQEAGLRFDTRAGAFVDLGDHRAIVPGDAAASEMYRRIVAEDEDQRMPPADTGRRLSLDEIGLVRRWIDEGAKWDQHWSFVVPRRPPLPRVEAARWPRNPIDHFVLARLEQESLQPSAEADRTTLIRRVTLDLTGLPPSPAEVDKFLSDKTAAAYDRLVNRLLASPRFGERMASPWLDAARYADTSGYQNDGPRYMWRWRDWVIDALNHNMPFDQFTIDQLAGDLLPSASLDQVIATGFNRNHRGNAEGGILPEEYAVEYVVDRVETTATVWLGLTIGCARCHDHKFDPISQKEFYQLFAYFNNVPEHGRAIKEGNSPPMIKAPTPWQQARLRELDTRLAEAETAVHDLSAELSHALAKWETSTDPVTEEDWSPSDGLVAHFPLDRQAADSNSEAPSANFQDGPPDFVSGPLGEAANFDGRRYVDCGDVAKFGYFDKFSLATWIHAAQPDGGTIISRMTDEPRADGYYVCLENGRIQVNLIKRWLDDSIRVAARHPLPLGGWHHVTVTYDGSRVASGINVYVDGIRQEIEVHLDGLNQSFTTAEPLRVGGGGGRAGRFHGSIDDVRVYGRELSPEEAGILATRETVPEILTLSRDRRTSYQKNKLRAYFLQRHAPDHIQAAYANLAAVRKDRAEFIESIPTVMVMQEMPTPRDTFFLQRGQYDRPGDKVAPALPASLSASAMPPQPNNRLGLARWLVDRSNPLTARVVVNRFWQMLFGVGLVKTAEDFGLQGERPSHPELLDWLATELIRQHWDVKALLKTIVTSATYRQSSHGTDELARRDPENRWLARGPRLRLSAEIIRDQALAASGLLVERLGGPSVKPYQPDGLWKEIATDTQYDQAHGTGLYRRSLYTYWKRTVAAPAMMTFDASARETCIVRKARTNTPLQALTLMNDVTFVECARVLAQRVMSEAGPAPDERIAMAFRLVTARCPRPDELAVLADDFHQHLQRYRNHPESAGELVAVGEYPVSRESDEVELAAYTVVASLILNLDETVTKE